MHFCCFCVKLYVCSSLNYFFLNQLQNDKEAQWPRVAVVILNWNGVHFLEKFLPSVTASTYPNLEIIVADNASTDHSVSFVQAKYPGISILLNDKNYGFAGGYNKALQQVNSEIFVLLNSDVEVTPDWLQPLITLLQANDKIAAVQPAVMNYAYKNRFEYAGAAGGWLDAYGYPFCRGRIFEECEEDHGQYAHAVPCFWASGAAFCIRAKIFKDVGGFDETFFAHQEEIDLCWRLQNAGHLIYAEPASKIYHVGGGTLPTGSGKKVTLNFRNNLLMIYKNLRGFEKWKVIVLRMMLDAVAAWRALFTGDAGFMFAVAKAHFEFFLRFIKGEVRTQPQILETSTLKGWYDGSIVWQFFIKRKKTFTQILHEQ